MTSAVKKKKEDHRFLAKHRRLWRVVFPVPRDLQQVIGKTKLQASLNETDISEARKKRWEHVARFQAQIDAARKENRAPVDLDDEAMAWTKPEYQDPQLRAAVLNQVLVNISEEDGYDPEEDGFLSPRAFRYGLIAAKEKTPFRAAESSWLRSFKGTPKTRYEFSSAIKAAEAFLKERDHDCLEDVTDKDVIDWRDHLLKSGNSAATVNKKMTGLRVYFDFVVAAGFRETNPFKKTSLAVTVTRKRRPYHIDEIAVLFEVADRKTLDALSIAMLGMRQSEQYQLRVRDVETVGNMTVIRCHGSKTENAERTLPIPESLLPLVHRLTKDADGKDRPAGDFLLPAPDPAKNKARGHEVGRVFMRWLRGLKKKGVKLGEDINETTDWHCWRRTTARLFELAGVAESTAARYLGHSSRLGMSYGLYSGDSDLGHLKAGIDAAFKVLPPSVSAKFH